jgi:hypothetical protein
VNGCSVKGKKKKCFSNVTKFTDHRRRDSYIDFSRPSVPLQHLFILFPTVNFWLRVEKVGAGRRNRLDELPTIVLQEIVSRLGDHDVLGRLLPAYPRLGAKLHNRLSSPSHGRGDMPAAEEILDECRRLPLLSVESTRYYEVSFRPTEPRLLAKWRRIIGGRNLYALAVSHLVFWRMKVFLRLWRC